MIEREYRDEVDTSLPFEEQIVTLADAFRQRLIELVGHWLRVGYCQGSLCDNCAVGGFTLDYGPFGFMEQFDPRFNHGLAAVSISPSLINQPQPKRISTCSGRR